MSLANPENVVTERRLAEFYQAIYPYLGGGGSPSPVTDATIYGIHIDRNESAPEAKITYLNDAVGKIPAYMNYTTGEFDYGSWENAFFMPKPCMLKYDGTVDYYLDPNDYTKKLDGTASDVGDPTYGGNAMMEWGQNGKKIWIKYERYPAGNIYVADAQVDEEYHDWSFHNAYGESVDHFYTPIYNGSLIDGKLRSLSGQQVCIKKTFQQEIDYAAANNPSGSIIWTAETVTDMDLINVLLLIISKSAASQTVFGMGMCSSGTESLLNSFRTGVHDDKGLFYGTNSGASSTYTNTVKVFGMENWWGGVERRKLGEIILHGVRKRKLTYNTEDGTSVVGYNLTGNGYILTDVPAPSGTSGSYYSDLVITPLGLFPTKASGGSATTHFCDGLWYDNSDDTYHCHGGASDDGNSDGLFATSLYWAPSSVKWHLSTCICAKPLSPQST